uniref:Serine/threonine protein phosphatase n=1 Tax=Anisakis simplex TaxID=6269 RepID=A0A0M3JE97_ANISI
LPMVGRVYWVLMRPDEGLFLDRWSTHVPYHHWIRQTN